MNIKLIILIILIVILFYFIYQSLIDTKFNVDNADIVIIGLGTSGAILTRRLHDYFPNLKIIVLDKGQNRRNDPIVYNTSKGAIAAYDPKYSSLYKSDNPNVQVTVGSMYGGSSSHNFGLTVHGSPNFYNNKWKKYLNLSFNDIIPYIKRIETYTGNTEKPYLRGYCGLLQVTQMPLQINVLPKIIPLVNKSMIQGTQILLDSYNTLNNLGPLRAPTDFSLVITNSIKKLKNIPIVEDYNTDVTNCACSIQQLFIDNISGLRSSTDVAYLPNNYIYMDDQGFAKEGNLQIIPNSTVNRIINNQVEWFDKYGFKYMTNINSNGKVIICSGSLNTPLILKRSNYTNPNIGKNLTTHYGCTMILSIEEIDNLNFSSGPLAFLPRTFGNDRDWQIVCGGDALLNKKLLSSVGIDSDVEQQKNKKLKYFVFLLWNLKPRTRGEVNLDPNNNNLPDIKLNLFKDGGLDDKNSDTSNILDGLKFMNKVALEMKKTYNTIKVVYPPENVFFQNDEAIVKYVYDGVSLTDHYCSTCSLGTVVNPIDFSFVDNNNIHIVDASVFPSISDGNTEFPTAVISEIASDRIIYNLINK